MTKPFNILFLCTGHSCRSQMAESWTRWFGSPLIAVQSAGIEAHGKNPHAVAVLKETGLEFSAQQSTRVTDAMLERTDLAVTVCAH